MLSFQKLTPGWFKKITSLNLYGSVTVPAVGFYNLMLWQNIRSLYLSAAIFDHWPVTYFFVNFFPIFPYHVRHCLFVKPVCDCVFNNMSIHKYVHSCYIYYNSWLNERCVRKRCNKHSCTNCQVIETYVDHINKHLCRFLAAFCLSISYVMKSSWLVWRRLSLRLPLLGEPRRNCLL